MASLVTISSTSPIARVQSLLLLSISNSTSTFSQFAPRRASFKPLPSSSSPPFFSSSITAMAGATAARVSVAPAIIVGGGRVGRALQDMGNGEDLLVKRGDPVPLDFPGPILVCTRNDDLEAVLQATPQSRWSDLVFFQNGMLEPWLESKGLKDANQVLAYFAVSKLGEPPIDGKTDTNPEGLTAAFGKWASAVSARLNAGGLSCKVLDKEAFQKQMLEKLIWISAFMLVGARHPGATVGVVESEFRSEANGQAEATNKALLDGIKKRLDEAKGRWAEELPAVLWAHRITPRRSTGESPFALTYGTDAVIPLEIGLPGVRTSAFQQGGNDEALGVNLDLLQERREASAVRLAAYQRELIKLHRKQVRPRPISVGDFVLRKVLGNTKDPTEGKLGPNWEGPYRVTAVLGNGAFKLEDMDGKEIPRTWNIYSLKRFYV